MYVRDVRGPRVEVEKCRRGEGTRRRGRDRCGRTWVTVRIRECVCEFLFKIKVSGSRPFISNNMLCLYRVKWVLFGSYNQDLYREP